MQPDLPQSDTRPLPTWLSIPIILLCLAGGGWIIHWYVMTDPLSHEAKILGDAPVQAQWPGRGGRGPRIGGGNNNVQRRSIRDEGDGRWSLRTEQAAADVAVIKGKLKWNTIRYNAYSFVPDAVKNTITSARTIAHDDTRIAALKLTPDQVKKLRPLVPYIPMVLSDADRNQLAAGITAYTQASEPIRATLEAKLLQQLDEVAQRSIAATQKQATDRATQINQIITPAQWQHNAALGAAPK